MGRPVPHEVREQIAKLRAEGMPRERVARKFGITIGTVTKIMKADVPKRAGEEPAPAKGE
jgi:DNA invertase Pin-like site-specific DNA recombinase